MCPYQVSILILLDYLLLLYGIPLLVHLQIRVSILILLDYLLLLTKDTLFLIDRIKSQSLFYWIIYSYYSKLELLVQKDEGLNPYFIGLSTLINSKIKLKKRKGSESQSLFYWIIYSYI